MMIFPCCGRNNPFLGWVGIRTDIFLVLKVTGNTLKVWAVIWKHLMGQAYIKVRQKRKEWTSFWKKIGTVIPFGLLILWAKPKSIFPISIQPTICGLCMISGMSWKRPCCWILNPFIVITSYSIHYTKLYEQIRMINQEITSRVSSSLLRTNTGSATASRIS